MIRRKLDMTIIKVRNWIYRKEEDLNPNAGLATIEIVLLCLVSVAIVVVFRGKITTILNTIFGKISDKVNGF